MPYFFIVLLPLAIILKWILSCISRYKRKTYQNLGIKPSENYLTGLNYLLSEQPDRAVDAFIKAIKIDSETIETHLALGSLFRKRGEVDRAIRIHQNLLARPQLSKQQRRDVLVELGRDYLSAGVLDRAEGVFLEVVAMDNRAEAAYDDLLEIYQLEQNWEQAILIAEKLQAVTKKRMHIAIAHYYCELAEQAIKDNDYTQANKHIKQALMADEKSIRANLLRGRLEIKNANYQAALQALKHIQRQNPVYIHETIQMLCLCYQHLNKEEEYFDYLSECHSVYPSIKLVEAMANYLVKKGQKDKASAMIVNFVQSKPALTGIILLLQQELNHHENHWQLIHELLVKIVNKQANYQCDKCGFNCNTLIWLCPSCHCWGTIQAFDK